MKLEEMRAEISSHPDFKNEKTKIEHFLNSKGYCCIFLPKFHCELNPIERCWGQAKRYTRAHCNYTIAGLLKNVPLALECVSQENIKNISESQDITCLATFKALLVVLNSNPL